MEMDDKGKMEFDEKEYFRNELQRKLNDKRNFLIESDRAVVIKADFPKSQFHFRVVAKEDLRDITQLSEDHLPLLDHMMELANQIIDKQEHLESRNFRIGFKVHTFWNRLNLHVISDDFYSMAMKRPRHWNSFNTELFMPFQIVHTMLSLQGSIEPISEERYKELQFQKPFHCNQCDFVTNLLLDLKAHLYHHWHLNEGEREQKKKLEKIIQMIDETKLDPAAVKPIELSTQTEAVAGSTQISNQNSKNPLPKPYQQQGQQQANNGYTDYMNGPPVNMMNLQNPNNPFRNTPPLNIQSLNPPQPNAFNYRPTSYQPRGPMPHQGRWASPMNGPRFRPNQFQNNFRHPEYNRNRAQHPINQQGALQYPIQSFAGIGAGPSKPLGLETTPRGMPSINQPNPNRNYQQNSNPQQPNQNPNQQNRPQYNQNRQKPFKQEQNLKKPQQPNRNQNPNQNTDNRNTQNPNPINRPSNNQQKKPSNKKPANKNNQPPGGNLQNQVAQTPPPAANNSKPANAS